MSTPTPMFGRRRSRWRWYWLEGVGVVVVLVVTSTIGSLIASALIGKIAHRTAIELQKAVQ